MPSLFAIVRDEDTIRSEVPTKVKEDICKDAKDDYYCHRLN